MEPTTQIFGGHGNKIIKVIKMPYESRVENSEKANNIWFLLFDLNNAKQAVTFWRLSRLTQQRFRILGIH